LVVDPELRRQIKPEWPQASAYMRNLQAAINGTNMQEPTQEMVRQRRVPRSGGRRSSHT
jgi:hypothetical protein